MLVELKNAMTFREDYSQTILLKSSFPLKVIYCNQCRSFAILNFYYKLVIV